jgi:branched-chain amino acid transport system substrate-binding protein
MKKAVTPQPLSSPHRRKALAAISALSVSTALPVRRAAAAARPVRIGYALAQSGPFKMPAAVTQERPAILWAEQINAAGGLNVQGVRRPVELVAYDDRGEVDLTTRYYLKLMTSDKVDLILAPWGSKATFAVAPLANKFGYPLLAATGMSRRLLDLHLPYFFSMLQQPDRMMGALIDVLKAQSVQRIAVLYMDDFFGTETLGGLELALRGKGIEVAERLGYPLGTKDLSAQLRIIKDSAPDAFIGVTYPDESLLAASQSAQIGFSPKLFFAAVGTCFPWYRQKLEGAAEGVLGMGTWNAKTSAGAKSFFDAHLKRFGQEPDRWSSGHAFAALQILQEAVGNVGLDRRAVREYIAGHASPTMLGPIRFEAGENVSLPGTVGQWQGHEFEIVWPPERATANVAYPKPAWS